MSLKHDHKALMETIERCTDLDQLPKIGYKDIASQISNDIFLKCQFSLSDSYINYIIDYYINNDCDYKKLESYIVDVLCECFDTLLLDDFHQTLCKNIAKAIFSDEELAYMKEEYLAIEAAKKRITNNEARIEAKHNRMMNKINNASNLTEFKKVPPITLDAIIKYIYESIDAIYPRSLDQSVKNDMATSFIAHLVEKGTFTEEFKNTAKESFGYALDWNCAVAISHGGVERIVDRLAKDNKLKNMIIEYEAKRLKKDELTNQQLDKEHQSVIKDINKCYNIKLLPNVNLGDITKRIVRDINELWNPDNFKISEISTIISYYMNNDCTFDKDKEALTKLLTDLIEAHYDTKYIEGNWKTTCEMIATNIIFDKKLYYLKQEFLAKEARKLFIYKYDHNETMDSIKNATRIAELPKITFSALTGYLHGNSSVMDPNNFRNDDFNDLARLLLVGKKWEDEEVIIELKSVVEKHYPDNKLYVYKTLRNKFMALPKTYYLVEEINAIAKQTKYFIEKHNSPANLYAIENVHASTEGGKFYNIYKNHGEKLDLSAIIPKDMDINVIEPYITDKYDKTFKGVGGMILNRDDSIGDIHAFKPNYDQIEITAEEKRMLDEIADLDQQIKNRKEELGQLTELNEETKKILMDIKNQAESLHQDYIDRINELSSILDNNSKKNLLIP